jgi:hypothetical protein
MVLFGRSSRSLMSLAALLAFSGPLAAQSMLGAPGLSPVAPGAAGAPPATFVAPPTAAPASSCETEMGQFQERRQTQIEALNKIVAAGKGKVDPVTSCPRLRSLVSVEGEMRAWMIKQKGWCNIPDEVIEGMKAGTAKTAQIAERACEAAAQMKRQQQAPTGLGAAPAMKLPSGPL